MEDKVLQNLITLYRSKGIPLDQIVNSELFRSLPVEKKIAVIKSVGVESQSKIKTIDSSDVKKILLGLGLGVLGGIYANNIANVYAGNVQAAIKAGQGALSVAPPPMVMMAITGGMAKGSISNLLNAKRDVTHKNMLKRVDTGNTNSILHYLLERDRYVSS